jgi:hypothetical protein
MDPDFSSQSDISPPQISLGRDDKPFVFFMFIIIIIVFVIVVVPWDKLGKNTEEMTGGTISQMFAQDSQDVYLKGNIDKLATGNFNLFWNQPTRGANVFVNRGQPMYSIILSDTPMNSNPTMLADSNNYVDNIINNQVNKKEEKLTFSNPVLTLDNLLAKSQINSLTPNEVKDYETVNGDDQTKSDYLSFPEASNLIRSTGTKHILPKHTQPKHTLPKQSKFVPTLPSYILPSSIPINVVANSNPYELSKVPKQAAVKKSTCDNLPNLTNWTPEDKLFQAYTNRNLNQKNCILDPASCIGFAGGRRLDDFVQTTKAVPNVNLDGNYYYPDSYVGSYFIDPNFDINKPYSFMPDVNRV